MTDTRRKTLVIGGSHGIGLSLAKLLTADGRDVVVAARTRGELDDASIEYVELDVTDAERRETVLGRIADEACIEGFAYCPGSIQLASLRTVTPEKLLQDFQLNVIGAVGCLQACLPSMKRAGLSSAVFFSSVAATVGLPMHTIPAASKSALEGMIRTWAAELSPTIRVNCVAPALTDTPLAARLLSNEKQRAAMAKQYPLGRFGAPQDPASAAHFLLSEASSWMTGQVLHVDGGMSSVIKPAVG